MTVLSWRCVQVMVVENVLCIAGTLIETANKYSKLVSESINTSVQLILFS